MQGDHYEQGDCVTTRLGGPEMIVEKAEYGFTSAWIHVYWMNGHEVCRQRFLPQDLKVKGEK